MLFVGDMMFDRGVEYYIYQNGGDFSYPFQKIKDDIDADVVFGNLEGPIVSNPVFISNHSMVFSFDKRIAQSLSAAGFDILSLANNHTFNMERDGFEETKDFLDENGIAYAGEPIGCDYEDAYIGDDFIIFAINQTFDFNCLEEEILSSIERLAEEDKFLIVSPHWGAEYKSTPSEAQKDLAHKMIDSGADLIMGGHSHVIGSIEKYKGKIIFYSLGNFIFDQSFSEETEQGLMVRASFYSDRIEYELIPAKENKSQPAAMADREKEDLLIWLSSISDENIRDEIKKGVIVQSVQ